MRLLTVSALALLIGCGKKESSALDEAYNAWKYRNFILGQTFSGGATLNGTVDIDASRDAGGPSDWIEVAINGNVLGRTSGSNRVSLQVRLRPGANWIRFFSSASRLGWEFQGDTNYGTHFDFTPKDKFEFEMNQRKDE